MNAPILTTEDRVKAVLTQLPAAGPVNALAFALMRTYRHTVLGALAALHPATPQREAEEVAEACRVKLLAELERLLAGVNAVKGGAN